MKTLLSTIALILISSVSHASFDKTKCGNSDGTVLTSALQGASGQHDLITIDGKEVDRRNISIKVISESILSQSSRDICQGNSGHTSGETLSVQKVNIASTDGSVILNGQIQLEANLICERTFNFLTFCRNPE